MHIQCIKRKVYLNMKKVLLVSCHGLGKGGVQSVMTCIVNNLSTEYTFDVLIFTYEEERYEKEYTDFGGQVFHIPNYEGYNSLKRRIDIYIRGLRIYTAAKKIFKENGPYAAVHCNNNFESCYILKAAKEAGIPVRISHAHNVINTDRHRIRTLFNKKCRKYINKYATHRIGCSTAACESLFGENTHFTVINNPYDESRFNPIKYNTKHFNAPDLVQVASYSSNKNQLFTLKVLKNIKTVYPNAKLSFIGFSLDDAYLNDMKKYIKDNSLENNVIFYEHDADTPSIMNESSYFLLPSKSEGAPIVIIEAQAMGLTCYVSDAVPTFANVGGCKYLSLDDGPKAWAERIISDFGKDKGAHHNYDCLSFTSENVAKTYDKLYRGENI
ncbi:MAG: glycosyltransferase family 1 protein [Ruminococcaceae bacterium]|nr:glycosyltransferase family 1 protein [Oscillospiraceae bacterium]